MHLDSGGLTITLLVLLIGLLINVHAEVQYPLTCNYDLTDPADPAPEMQAQGTFRLTISENTQWTPEQEIFVRLENSNPDSERQVKFIYYMIQGHDVRDRPVGRWLVGPGQQSRECNRSDDTIMNAEGGNPVTKVEAVFIAPPAGSVLGEAIDFNAVVMTSDGKYWNKIRSVLLTEAEMKPETQPNPEKPESNGDDADEDENEEDRDSTTAAGFLQDDDHDFKVETDMKKEKEQELKDQKAEEDENTEEDDENEEEKEAREEENREMIKYEEEKKEKERQRQEMINFELRDKLEYEEKLRKELEERLRAMSAGTTIHLVSLVMTLSLVLLQVL